MKVLEVMDFQDSQYDQDAGVVTSLKAMDDQDFQDSQDGRVLEIGGAGEGQDFQGYQGGPMIGEKIRRLMLIIREWVRRRR